MLSSILMSFGLLSSSVMFASQDCISLAEAKATVYEAFYYEANQLTNTTSFSKDFFLVFFDKYEAEDLTEGRLNDLFTPIHKLKDQIYTFTSIHDDQVSAGTYNQHRVMISCDDELIQADVIRIR